MACCFAKNVKQQCISESIRPPSESLLKAFVEEASTLRIKRGNFEKGRWIENAQQIDGLSKWMVKISLDYEWREWIMILPMIFESPNGLQCFQMYFDPSHEL